MTTPDAESVEYDVLIEATLALKNLADLTNSTESFNQKIRETTLAVKSASEQWGVSFGQAKNTLQQLDEQMSGTKESSVIFGGVGQAAWNQVGQGATQAGQAVEKSSSQMANSINVVRVALHLLIVGAIFEVINAFRQMFTESIAGLKSLEVSVYNLANAERALSQSGIEITFKDLEAIVDRLHTKFEGLFSKVAIQDAVADIAIATKDLGLSQKQIEQIASSAAALQLRNPEKTLQEVNKQLLTAILSGQTKGLRSLGVEANSATIAQKALEMGLVKAGQKMDDQAKSLATLQIIYEATAGDAKNLTEYQFSVAGATQKLSATWQDFLAEAAKDFAPLIITGLQILIKDLQLASYWFQKASPAIQTTASSLAAFIQTAGALAKIPMILLQIGAALATISNVNSIATLKEKLDELKNIGATFGSKFEASKKLFDNYFDHFTDSADTATAAVENLGEAFDKAGFTDAIEKIVKDTSRDLEDLSTELNRKQEDIDTKYQDKAEDALIKYQNKVKDINIDANNSIADAKAKHRQDDVKREQDYQLKLWELQQKYLMDLEDALHNRDARQIIRLQNQYALDKAALDKKKNLDDKQAKNDLQNEINKIERERKIKLDAAQRDYAEELAQQQLARERDERDLQIWESRKRQDIQIAERRKLEDLIDSWIKQGKITKEGAQSVYDILKHYFGPGGMTDQIYAYMENSLINAALEAQQAIDAIIPPALNSPNTTSGAYSQGNGQTSLGTFAGGLAEGGSFLATTPQTLRVAENVPEMITATPLGGRGTDMNKLFMQTSMNKNAITSPGGQLELGVTLSPDLETRIIRKSLDSAADVVMKVNRSKV